MEYLDPEKKLVTILPTWSVTMIKGNEIRRAVRVYRSEINVCNHRGGQDRCDESGLYYSTGQQDDGRELKLCPRHWYEIHYVPWRFSILVDMEPVQYAEELGRLVRSQ